MRRNCVFPSSKGNFTDALDALTKDRLALIYSQYRFTMDLINKHKCNLLEVINLILDHQVLPGSEEYFSHSGEYRRITEELQQDINNFIQNSIIKHKAIFKGNLLNVTNALNSIKSINELKHGLNIAKYNMTFLHDCGKVTLKRIIDITPHICLP